MGFTTPSYDLLDLFSRVDRGDLQLPDFQQDYRWDVDRIRSLLVTVLRGYPMGAFLALDVRNEPMSLKPRVLTSAPETDAQPDWLLLDGQQRLTTLYQCLRGEGVVQSVDFRDKKVKRRFYIDVNKAVSADVMPDEAVISVDETGHIKSHFAPELPGGIISKETALEAGYIPVSDLLFDAGTDQLFEIAAGADEDAKDRAKQFYTRIIKSLVRYSVPIILLERQTAQGGIGSIFAQANSIGLQMDVFELLTAKFALEDPEYQLRRDWEKTEKTLRQFPALDGITRTDFLTAVSLYVTAQQGHASGFRESVLDLTLEQYQPAAHKMRIAFNEAAIFMAQRCIFTTEQVPYSAQLVPLAVMIALLSEDPSILANQAAWDRIYRWFWCGVFSEAYGSPALMVRIGTDVDQVTEWVKDYDGKHEVATPRSIMQARFVESRLLSAGPTTGLYKGLYALIMGRGAKDWRTTQPFNLETFQIMGTHFRRIFPSSWCEANGIDKILADSVLNRTPMSRRTYVMIEQATPARYLYRIQSKSLMDDEEFDAILSTHYLNPELVLAARAQDFFKDRRHRILAIIEEAMGIEAVHDVDDANLYAGEEGPEAFA